MLDDADFERVAHIINMAIDTPVRGVIAEEVRKAIDERVTAIIDQRVAAIVDARMHTFEARFEKRIGSLEQRIAVLDEQIKELRVFAIQTRDKQREIMSTLTQIGDNLKGLYARDMAHEERLDAIDQIIHRWGAQYQPPPQG